MSLYTAENPLDLIAALRRYLFLSGGRPIPLAIASLSLKGEVFVLIRLASALYFGLTLPRKGGFEW